MRRPPKSSGKAARLRRQSALTGGKGEAMMNTTDIILIAGIALVVGLAVAKLVRNRKKGKCACGCDVCTCGCGKKKANRA